jgi:hypothetical protein
MRFIAILEVLALLLILSGCASGCASSQKQQPEVFRASIKESLEDYIFDQMKSQMDFCDTLPKVQQQDCYDQFSRDFRARLKAKYPHVADAQMIQALNNVSENAKSPRDIAVGLENEARIIEYKKEHGPWEKYQQKPDLSKYSDEELCKMSFINPKYSVDDPELFEQCKKYLDN